MQSDTLSDMHRTDVRAYVRGRLAEDDSALALAAGTKYGPHSPLS